MAKDKARFLLVLVCGWEPLDVTDNPLILEVVDVRTLGGPVGPGKSIQNVGVRR